MKKSFKKGALILILFLFTGMNMIYAQQKSVNGNVKDEYNSPLPGVTVIVKGTTTGTISDVDGNYSITLHPQLNC